MAANRKTKAPDWFDIPVFPIPIYNGKVMLTTTRDEWASVAATYDSDPDSDECKGLSIRHYTPNEGRIYVIGVFDGAIDTFVHELAHATFHILGDVGVELVDNGANESYTYLIAYLMREVFPVFLSKIKS
jgi:hypothetical protein